MGGLLAPDADPAPRPSGAGRDRAGVPGHARTPAREHPGLCHGGVPDHSGGMGDSGHDQSTRTGGTPPARRPRPPPRPLSTHQHSTRGLTPALRAHTQHRCTRWTGWPSGRPSRVMRSGRGCIASRSTPWAPAPFGASHRCLSSRSAPRTFPFGCGITWMSHSLSWPGFGDVGGARQH